MELVVFLCAGRNMPSRPCGICSGSLHDYWHAPLAALGRSQFRVDVQCASVDGVVHEEKSPLVECAPHVRWQDEARSDETDTAGEGWPLQLLVCPVPRAGVTLSLSLVQCSKDAAVQEEPLGVGSFSFEVPSALLQGSAECDGMRQRKCVELSVPKGGGREGGVAGSKQGKEEYAGGCGWKQGLQPPQPDDLVVGLDGKCPTTIDLWLVWRFPGTVGRVLKDVPLVRPDENVAWGALARRRPRRNQHTSLVRATLPPFPAGTKNAKAWGEEEEEAVLQIFGGAGMLGSSRTRSQKGSGEQSSLQAVDHLSYVDAPVWRRRNGEVLVGRDVLPHVGMRVNISRQALRWRYEQSFPSGKEAAASASKVETTGTITKILAGASRVRAGGGEPERIFQSRGNVAEGGARFTRSGNGMTCSVRWDDGSRGWFPAGLRGDFHLVPDETACWRRASSSIKAPRALVDAIATCKFVTC